MNGADGSTHFQDDSDLDQTVTAVGTAQVDTAQFKFGGASGLFDGNSDYLTYSQNVVQTGDINRPMTIDCWIRFNSLTGTQYIAVQSNSVSPGTEGDFGFLWIQSSSELRIFRFTGTNDDITTYDLSWSPSVDTWYHVAGVWHADGTGALAIDGVYTAGTSGSATSGLNTEKSIGGSSVGSYFNGWIDELRIVDNRAMYDGNFTPPDREYNAPDETSSSSTAALLLSSSSSSSTQALETSSSTSISSSSQSSSSSSSSEAAAATVLLLHMDDTALKDDSDSHHTTNLNGGMGRDTGTKKFGAASALFDGADDYIDIANSTDWAFGSDDFTIDFWLILDTDQDCGLVGWGKQVVVGEQVNWLVLYYATGNYISFYRFDVSVLTEYTFTWNPNTSQWYHVAFTRSGNDLRCFIDGTQIGSTEDVTGVSYSQLASKSVHIGHYISGAGGSIDNYLDGNIDELRILNGKAAWTSNFTPPTAPYSKPNESSSSSSSP